MPIPPSSSINSSIRTFKVTSKEGIFERVGVKDAESMRSADCEAPMVLVKANVVDLFSGKATLSSLDKGCMVDYGRHYFIINVLDT